jgi:hypothetical protein
VSDKNNVFNCWNLLIILIFVDVLLHEPDEGVTDCRERFSSGGYIFTGDGS